MADRALEDSGALPRRRFLTSLGALAALGAVAPAPSLAQGGDGDPAHPFTLADLEGAERLLGTPFTPAERELMLKDLREALATYDKLRAVELDNGVQPAFRFDPLLPGQRLPPPPGTEPPWQPGLPPALRAREDLAWCSVAQLAALLDAGKTSSMELTELALARLERHDPVLRCVITPMSERALAAAARADEERKAGRVRGPLHGIPYGAKDLLAARGARTTWGAMPYKDQLIDHDAAVITRLEQAGAVLVAKLSLGALAWGDVWFDATTKNPWNTEQGSSGSSAGSASAVAAGLVPFAIGSETYGSIVSPCTRCGATGLRPTFGRVSRAGAMTLSWTLDKLGPIARSVEDCSLVLEAIAGADGVDPTAVDLPHRHPGTEMLAGTRVGFVASEMQGESPLDMQVLEDLRALGIEPVPVAWPEGPAASDLMLVLSVEAAAAFDALTRSGRDDLMVRQERFAWPNTFRAAQMVPAVEYVRAMRLRTLLMEGVARVFDEVDVVVSPSFGAALPITNLTGHPCVVAPCGFDGDGDPASITFIGGLYREESLVAVASAWQSATRHNEKRPMGF